MPAVPQVAPTPEDPENAKTFGHKISIDAFEFEFAGAQHDALAMVEPMVDTSRFGSHVWPKRAPELGQAVQVFIRLKKRASTESGATKGPV